MGFGQLDTWDIPTIRDYAAAVKHEASIKPIRGDANNTKPIGKRSRKQFNIRKEEATGDIIVRMRSTDVIRYCHQGDVVVTNGGWPTASTHSFIYAVLGLMIRTFNNKSFVECYYTPKGQTESVKGEFCLPNNRLVTFRRIDHKWHSTEVSMPSIHVVDRKAANLVRKRYAEFRKYLSGMLKLRSEQVEVQHWGGPNTLDTVVRFTPDELAQLNLNTYNHNLTLTLQPHNHDTYFNLNGHMLSGDTERFYKAALMVARASYAQWYNGNRDLLVYPKEVLDYLNRIILFIHKDEVLKLQEAGASAKRDPYGAWFA